MYESNSDALALSRKLLRVLIALNVLMAFVILGLLIFSFLAEDRLLIHLGSPSEAAGAKLLMGMRLIAVIGIAAVPVAHVVLSGLLAIVETVKVGDPFVSENADRLETMAWAVLGLELMHLAVGAVAAWASSDAHPLDIDWSFSFNRWIAVLLLFVLARVFEQGARMRDELAGTV